MVPIVLYVLLLVASAAGSRDKRLVLHSDTNVAVEILKLREEITKLQQNDITKDNETASLRAEIMKLQNSDLKKDQEISSLRSELLNHRQSSGTVYVRWGKDSCPQNGTTLIYKGYMAGKGYTHSGSGADSLCLPEDPTWGRYQDGSQSIGRAYMYGTEYEEFDGNVFGKRVGDQDVPCAVCKVPGVWYRHV